MRLPRLFFQFTLVAIAALSASYSDASAASASSTWCADSCRTGFLQCGESNGVCYAEFCVGIDGQVYPYTIHCNVE